MKILIFGEYSGRTRNAFRERGHDAWSVDFEPADDNSIFHIQGDGLPLLNDGWDMMIGHPTCTFLCNSGVRWLYETKVLGERVNRVLNTPRWNDMEEAAAFFRKLQNAPIPKIALENPVMHGHAKKLVGEQTQCVQPYWFGEPAFKGTCLWLKNLPPLVATNKLVKPKPGTPEHKEWSAIHRAPPGPDRWKIRSRSFQGISDAMAKQWG